MLEHHHQVELLDEAIEAAVQLSHRYIPSRQLPDKAISLLDTACARVAVSQHATPAQVEDLDRRLAALEIEAGIIEREEAIGIDVTDRKAEVDSALASVHAELDAANTRWEAEKALVSDILDLRHQLRSAGGAIDSTSAEDAGKDDDSEDAAPRAKAQRRAPTHPRPLTGPQRLSNCGIAARNLSRRRGNRRLSCLLSIGRPSPRSCRTGPGCRWAGCWPAKPAGRWALQTF